MNRLNPQKLFERIATDVPQSLHRHLFVTGSLAAAYHYKSQLRGQAINTKDADLVIHPAGDTDSCRKMTDRLRESGWRNTGDCFPRDTAEPADELRAIRLLPPESNEYFVEFLNIPQKDHRIGIRTMFSFLEANLARLKRELIRDATTNRASLISTAELTILRAETYDLDCS